MISAWLCAAEAKYPGERGAALPMGCHRVPTSPQQGDDLSVVFHTCGGFGCSPFMHIFRAGHFHICARRGIYETVTDSWALPPTSTAQFLAGLGKWTRKEEPKKGQKVEFVPRHRLYSVKRQKLGCVERTQDVLCRKTGATLPWRMWGRHFCFFQRTVA